MKLNLEKNPNNELEFHTIEPKTKKKKNPKKPDFLKKHTINLMYTEQAKGNNPKIVLPVAVLVFLLILLFTKFMVIDKVATAMRAEAEIQSVRTQTEALRQQNQNYDKIKAEYNRFSNAAYNDEELSLIGVDHVLTLIDNRIIQRADIESCVYGENVLNVVLSDVTLQETSDIVSLLYQDPYVTEVSVSTASTNEQENPTQKVVANMTIQLSTPKEEAQEEVAAE